MNIVLGMSIFLVSGLLGCYLDLKKKVKIAPVYWLIGTLGGFFGAIVMGL